MKAITIPLKLPSDCIPLKLNWIPPGRFIMGDKVGDYEEPMGEFEVIISRGFWLGMYPITQCQWQTVMDTNPSKFEGNNQPVNNIGWQDAIDFCNLLNASPLSKPKDYIFSLPTEAQWEYACYAGTRYKYQIGDTLEDLSRVAWHDDNLTMLGTQDVGQKEPNNWGFYDMLGNVMEWCFDSPTDYPAGTIQVDYIGEFATGFRNLRGGSAFISSNSSALTCSGRMYTDTNPNPFFGFRLCLRYGEPR